MKNRFERYTYDIDSMRNKLSAVARKEAAKASRGFTLVELTIAMMLIGFIVVAAYPLIFHSVSSLSDTRTRTSAESSINSKIEMLRANPTCAAIQKVVSSSGTTPAFTGSVYKLSVTLPSGCVPGTAVPISLKATKPSGSELISRKIQVLVTPTDGQFDVVGGS
jgi:prepilin-type N-terminal cleavage/methylation domain-containing protein